LKSNTTSLEGNTCNMERSTKTNQQFGFFRKGFLLLKRKAGQGFHIDSEAEIVVAKIENGVAYLAIKAPNKKVLRTEILSNEPRTPEATS